MKKLLKEPLLHFLAIGAVLFAVNAWREPARPKEDAAPRIDVTAAVIERLRAGFERQFGQSPDAEETRGLVQAHIREEVLYREALAMGLDRDDSIVRRRMAQKMEFLTNDIVGAAEPDDAALRQYFTKNALHYAKPERLGFRHIYFSKEKRGQGLDAAARDTLVALGKGTSEESVGDSFLHGFEFDEQEPSDVTALFGAEFTARITGAVEGEWFGPVASSYGLHLVRIEKRGPARAANFDEVRDTVLRDFNDEQRRTANQEVFEKLRDRYVISIDEPAMAKAAEPAKKTVQR